MKPVVVLWCSLAALADSWASETPEIRKVELSWVELRWEDEMKWVKMRRWDEKSWDEMISD